MIKSLYVSIVIVINKLKKYVHFVLFRKNFDVKKIRVFFH